MTQPNAALDRSSHEAFWLAFMLIAWSANRIWDVLWPTVP